MYAGSTNRKHDVLLPLRKFCTINIPVHLAKYLTMPPCVRLFYGLFRKRPKRYCEFYMKITTKTQLGNLNERFKF